MQKNRGAISGTWIAMGAVALVVILVVIAAASNKNADSALSSAKGTPTSWKRGPDTARVKIAEFADFQCPACAGYHGLVKEIETLYPVDVQVQFKHYPLFTIHRNAVYASRAAEAAGKQGKFWEMHDMLFEKQKDWSEVPNAKSVFEGYARDLGLNVDQFKTESKKSDELDGPIVADRAEGDAVGVKGTPTFVINGTVLAENPKSLDEFKALIEEAKKQ